MTEILTRRQFLRSTATAGVSLTAAAAAMSRSLAQDAERTLEVAAFGAVGDGRTDDWQAIQDAIRAAVASGPGARVMFDAGKTYRLAARKEGCGMLMVEGARELTLDGRGATLLAHPTNRILALHDSRDVLVCNFLLDYDPLPFTQAQMTRIDLPEGRVRFRVAQGYGDPATAGEDRYGDFKWSDCVFLAADTRRFTHAWLRLRGIKPADRGEFEAVFHGGAARVGQVLQPHRPGDWIAIKMLYPPGTPRRTPEGRFTATGAASINVAFCHGITLEHITSYAAPNMTFNAHGSENVRLRRCEVRRKPGTDRLIAGNSDGCHLKSLTIMPRLLDCRFDALMDDSVHIKISSNVVAEVDGRRVRLNHGDIAYNDVVIEPGQALAFYGWEQRRHLAFAEVLEVRRTRYREVWATLDRNVPGLSTGDLAFPRPVNEAEVRRCRFGSQLKTAVLLRPPGSVADCTFDGVAYGVHTFLNDRVEGPVPHGIAVRRCRFLHPSIAGVAASIPHRAAAPPGTHGLLVEDSRFVLSGGRGRAVVAANQTGVTLRNLAIEADDGRDPTSLVELRGCAEVTRENDGKK